ncbi:chemotaxis protein CheR [Ruminococcaceae bacterium OttesenSCG-928-D13]|nr:chemotaxis protein CheR [Ruminococcaceae bacterium OttesenSCG-928-D13]
MIELTEKEFVTLRDYVLGNFGIDLSKKKVLIQGRLTATLTQRGFKTFTEYIDFVKADKTGTEVNLLLNKLTTNLTYFMREKEHFEFLHNVVLPEFDRTKRREIRLWSAGCSSGEEPYTLAMTLANYYAGKPNPPKISILASDISQKVLTSAQAAIYPAEGLKDMPAGWAAKYFDKVDADQVKVKDDIKKLVTFRTVNLMDPFRFRSPFEIIFCRNVMIYFEKERKNDLVNRFYQWVAPGFYFFISHSENVDRGQSEFRMVKPSIFRRDV